MGAPATGRALESGAVLAVLTTTLVVTGALLSPTLMARVPVSAAVQGAAANALYATHVAAGVAFVACVLVHLVPFRRSLARKAGVAVAARAASWTLLALAAVEAVTGLVLWARTYGVLGKREAVAVHLLAAVALLVPFVLHAARGLGVWRARLRAGRLAHAAAAVRGLGAEAAAARDSASRRRFVRLAAVGVAALALASVVGRFASRQVGAWRVNSVGDIPPLAKETWRLTVTGAVARPVEIGFDELLAMPQHALEFTHRCVEGWTYTDTFTGVRLRDVLAQAGGVRPEAVQLVFKSPEVSKQRFARGRLYTTNFPVEDGLHDDVLLVHQAGGEDLTPEHGAPVRLMTPRKWGYKACKWVTEIEATTDARYQGYWESLGYHNDGDYPGPIFR